MKTRVSLRYFVSCTRKYRGTAHTDCHIKANLYRKISAVFHNLKEIDCCFLMQELGKFIFTIIATPTCSERYMSLDVSKKVRLY